MKKLPLRPSLEQLKKQAKAVLKGRRRTSEAKFTLSDAQRFLANEYGFRNWADLKAHVQSHRADAPSDAAVQALWNAAQRNDLRKVRETLDEQPELVNERGGPGPGLHSTMLRHKDTTRLWSSCWSAVRIQTSDARATTRCRCISPRRKQHLSTIHLLIEHGADPIGEGDYHELEVIGWATSFDYLNTRKEVVEYLIAHGAEHNIFSAVSMGEVEAIRKLVAYSRSNLEKRMELTNKRRRPLHLAVVKRQPKSLVTLLDLGAKTETLDEAGFTALDQAALCAETEMAQILLDRGAEVRLPAAIALQRTRDVERLLRRDPECLKAGKRWGNLIVRASEIAAGDVVERLILSGASVDVRDDPKTAIDSTSGYTPLHGAAWFGNRDAAIVL